MRKLVIWSVAVLAVTASAAIANAKESTFSIGLSHGSSNVSAPDKLFGPNDYVSLGSSDEIGVNAEYGMAMADDYAMAISVDYRMGSFKQEPTTNAPAFPTLKVSSTSFKVRVGGDRTGKIGDRFKWFMGPGLEYGSAKAKFKEWALAPLDDVDGEPTTRFGVSGRLGGVMMLGPTVGIKGQIGDTFGLESAKDTGGKTTSTYSSFESAWSVQFAFGGK